MKKRDFGTIDGSEKSLELFNKRKPRNTLLRILKVLVILVIAAFIALVAYGVIDPLEIAKTYFTPS